MAAPPPCLQLKAQLESALRDAEAALAGLGPEPAGAASEEAQHAGGGATALPRRAAPASNNSRIHPRSKYAHEEPNFEALAARHPSLAPFLIRPAAAELPSRATRPSLDFASPAACRELTRVLLAEDFGLQWWVPLGQLVPPVTNRANYIHWLEDLLTLSAPPGKPQRRAALRELICSPAPRCLPHRWACLQSWRTHFAACCQHVAA